MTPQANILSGREIASGIQQDVVRSVELLQQKGIKPNLAVILVGSDPASHIYVGAKSRAAEACGIAAKTYALPAETTEHDVLSLVETLNSDPGVHGILVQLPLPGHISEDKIVQSISSDKDVDGFHYLNVGKTASGNERNAFVPCTPAGILFLLETVLGPDLAGKEAVVVGRSNIVGRPVAALLLSRNATVTTAHSRTAALGEVCRRADILVVAAGKPGLVQADWVKPGCVVVDVGINRTDEAGTDKPRIVGDVDFTGVAGRAGAITPVPGGVGPMTIAMLMLNTVKAAAGLHKVALQLEPEPEPNGIPGRKII